MNTSRARKYETRTYLELSVGTTHLVEVVVHLRNADLHWWNKDVSRHEAELMKIISRKILAVEEVFRNEILGKQSQLQSSDRKSARKIKKNEYMIGEKNIAESKRGDKQKELENKSSESKKRKFSKSKLGVSTEIALRPKAANSLYARPNILYGDLIQIVYKIGLCESNSNATLFFNESLSQNNKNQGVASKKRKYASLSFGQLKKLSNMIEIWCFNDPKSSLPDDGGFPRPDMIPLTSLFKE